MEKNNKIILIAIIILTVLVLILCGYSLINKKNNLTDAQKFRNEYMELNDQVNSDNVEYPMVNISEDNTVIYANEKKVIEILEKGSGVIYFGFNSCPWCRTLVNPLIDVAKEMNENIYYLDIKDIRSMFEIVDGDIENIKKGSEGYYKILSLLDEYLDEYYLTDENYTDYDTLEKRIYAPTLIAVKDGLVTDMHVGTIDSQESGYDKLEAGQLKELKQIIKDLINSKN